MQLSQTLSSAIAQIKVSNSPFINHKKKKKKKKKRFCPSALLHFSISVKPEDKFLVDCFNWGRAVCFFFPLAVVVVEERF